MLKEIKIQNYKLFEKQVEFGNLRALNLLTGINGRGKSSFLQSMLLMNQSILANENTKSLVLSGDNISVGTADDAKNSNISITEPVVMCFLNDEGEYIYHFVPWGKNDSMIPIGHFTGNLKSMHVDADLNDEWFNLMPSRVEKTLSLGRTLRDLQFISAGRIEPQSSYSAGPMHRVKPDATNSVCVLYTHKEDTVRNAYLDALEEVLPSWKHKVYAGDISIGGQVDWWMTKMFGETKIEAKFFKEVEAYTLRFKTQERQGWFKPTNVGFGYSYVLPILVAGLISKEGDILIVENPEAHLHPQGQSMIAKFLACIAMSGVQVFIETHSEHILNSIRVLIRQETLTPEDVSVKYFMDSESYFEEIHIDERGKVLNWQKGFFDQEERDLDILLS